jgi:hypothetical protein
MLGMTDGKTEAETSAQSWAEPPLLPPPQPPDPLPVSHHWNRLRRFLHRRRHPHTVLTSCKRGAKDKASGGHENTVKRPKWLSLLPKNATAREERRWRLHY